MINKEIADTKIKDKKFRNLKNLFAIKNVVIKNKIIRDISMFFMKKKQIITNQLEQVIFLTIILNVKAMVTKTKPSQIIFLKDFKNTVEEKSNTIKSQLARIITFSLLFLSHFSYVVFYSFLLFALNLNLQNTKKKKFLQKQSCIVILFKKCLRIFFRVILRFSTNSYIL